MSLMRTSPINPHDLAHEIFNQLALISGHTSLLQTSPNLTTNEQQATETVMQAVYVIKERVRLLVDLANTAASTAKSNQSIG